MARYRELNYGITFAEGATYIRMGGHHVGHASAHILVRTVLCCALLCTTVVHNDTHTHKAVLTADCWLFSFRLSFRVFVYRSNVLCVFCFSLDCFVLVLLAFVGLGLVSSVLSQEI